MSDSDDEFCYTNTASLIRALKRKIETNPKVEELYVEPDESFEGTSPRTSVRIKSKTVDIDEGNTDEEDTDCDDTGDSAEFTPPKSPIRETIIPISPGDDMDESFNIIDTIDNLLTNKRKRPARRGAKRPQRSTRRNPPPETALPVDIVISDTELEDPEVIIKVYWKSSYVDKFSMRRTDKMIDLFDYFAAKEKLPTSRLLFTLGDRVIGKSDTPASLDLGVASIIEGGVLSEKFATHEPNIQLKAQMKNVKRPLVITIARDDKMNVFMSKCAEQLEVPVKTLTFYFDGDVVNGDDTPITLELEGDECIDCVVK